MNKELLEQCAQRLHIPAELLQEQLCQLPKYQHPHLNELLYVANRYELDPLTGEVILIIDQGHTRPYITMDGWMRLMNQLPHFCGVQFRDSSELIDDLPSYVECTIYRDDRVVPICIREYYQEIKQESETWLELPHRMMRHRALKQALRLAFGISTLEQPSPYVASHPPVNADITPKPIEKKTAQLKQLLKKEVAL